MSNYEKFVDRLFDENNDEKIWIKDNDGKELEFEQVAVIDFEENYYAILHPISRLEGVSEDEVLIFLIDEEKDQLVYEENDKVIDGVYNEFCRLVEEQDDEE